MGKTTPRVNLTRRIVLAEKNLVFLQTDDGSDARVWRWLDSGPPRSRGELYLAPVLGTLSNSQRYHGLGRLVRLGWVVVAGSRQEPARTYRPGRPASGSNAKPRQHTVKIYRALHRRQVGGDTQTSGPAKAAASDRMAGISQIAVRALRGLDLVEMAQALRDIDKHATEARTLLNHAKKL